MSSGLPRPKTSARKCARSVRILSAGGRSLKSVKGPLQSTKYLGSGAKPSAISCVNALCARRLPGFNLKAVSKHLRVLEQAGLMGRQKEGRVHHCRLVAGPLQDAAEWLAFYERFWEGKLDALADYLADLESER